MLNKYYEVKLVTTSKLLGAIVRDGQGFSTFHSDKEGFYISDYIIRDFIQEKIEMKIEGYVSIVPRNIYLGKELDGCLGRTCLLNSGSRVLKRSDYFKEGLEINFYIINKTIEISIDTFKKILSCGEYKGIGRGRSGGFGTFKVVSILETKKEFLSLNKN